MHGKALQNIRDRPKSNKDYEIVLACNFNYSRGLGTEYIHEGLALGAA